MERKKLDALLLLAGVAPVAVHKLANKYWPECDAYAQLRRDTPWWLVLTHAGPVVIGWRKRVISISWVDSTVRALVTADDTTKGEDHVHAWSYGKAVIYLHQIAQELNTVPTPESSNAEMTTTSGVDCPVIGL